MLASAWAAPPASGSLPAPQGRQPPRVNEPALRRFAVLEPLPAGPRGCRRGLEGSGRQLEVHGGLLRTFQRSDLRLIVALQGLLASLHGTELTTDHISALEEMSATEVGETYLATHRAAVAPQLIWRLVNC